MTLPQRVLVVGTGLLGTSMALALRSAGVDVTLSDTSPTAAALASDMGGGRVAHTDDRSPELVVVAAPPDVVADVVAAQLDAWPDATVTDVTSVKEAVVRDVGRLCPDALHRFVPGHPMAGRERSGAVAARSDLFVGRTWVICPGAADEDRVAQVRQVAETCGAHVVAMDPREHDAAVAAVSHVPQVAASLVAAQLRDIPEAAVGLSGQGVRDVTRIASSDPMLWTQILAGNAAAVLPVLERIEASIATLTQALRSIDEPRDTGDSGVPGPRAVLAQTIAAGQEGRARIPGKHGAPAQTYTSVVVVVPDEPGALGRLFTLIGETGVSIEDMRIEHDEGVAVGLLELSVLPLRAQTLTDVLNASGWAAHLLDTH